MYFLSPRTIDAQLKFNRPTLAFRTWRNLDSDSPRKQGIFNQRSHFRA
jgi:hypothetical protein